MTAPGNSALVISLLAVFVACMAYAIGRWHQRGRDREDAYREGYDNATRRTFSLAAHLVARRRVARPAADPITGGPVTIEPEPDPATQPLPVASPRPASGLPASSRPALFVPPEPASFDPPSSAVAASPPGTTSPVAGGLLRRSGVPGSKPRSPAAEYDATSLGFPVPPPAPPQLIGEPAAFGGVVYRPFPDPRPVGDAEPLPADRGSLHGVPAPRSHPSVPGLSESATGEAGEPSSTAAADGGPAPSGRHTVPDELVRSATYRLPADRVFRAKVPESTDRPGLPEEPTTRLWLPKPRQS